MQKTLCVILACVALSGCASNYSHTDDALGGVIGGAIAGGIIGAGCCVNPAAGVLIGGVAGGLVGYAWPINGVPTK